MLVVHRIFDCIMFHFFLPLYDVITQENTDEGSSIFCHIFLMETNERLTARGFVQLI